MNGNSDTIREERENGFIDSFTGRFCRPHSAVVAERLAQFVHGRRMEMMDDFGAACPLAAGKRDRAETQGAAESPAEEVCFVFASECEADAADGWRATVTVPPRAKAGTMIGISVSDAAGRPSAGVFTIAGCSLPLMGGRSEMTFGQFLSGIKDTAVSLRRAAAAVPGRLMFF